MAPGDLDSLGGQPPVAKDFVLEVDGLEIGMFGRVSGLEVSIEVDEYAEGGVSGFVHRFPGQMRWPNLVFSRGLARSDNLFTWMEKSAGAGFQAAGGKLVRNTASVTVLDAARTRLRAYEIEGAFAVRWSGPSLDTLDGTMLSEELEVAHNGFRSSTLT
ncbi:phage tail protein [Kineosporia babensis]|uniref:Phage tail protein n=1 Tax=Kineosporia babensis TaxID=499548 RepID=A0A9X1NB03_9ACTN|nr:phage tail protein [Kineosporia babensis]MCD5310429.1 phage tail protein [Kineosporia babensis]